MIVSVNWLKKFTTIDMPVADLAVLIGARLVEIESVIELNDKYKDVVIAKVITCEKLEGSDHLSVTKIDDGGRVKDVERDDNGFVQVVCGAPNVRAGLMVAWLPPKTVVPETFGSAEPFMLGARTMLGTMSNGMLASAKELDLYDDHTGITELDDTLTPGTAFTDAYDFNDTLLDIENKSLTHRPDAFGVVGFAREVAGIQGKAFTTPEFLSNSTPDFAHETSVETPHVTIDNPEVSDRYQAIVVGGAKKGALSPFQIQTYIARVGMRPISAVVDVTNMLMLATGQPLHAFDYDKLVKIAGGKAEIHVRDARKGETLELLDGRTVELSPEDIVIAAGETPVALAGAMGGAATEIDEHTENIIIESATFNLYRLRATQMRHGIFSEAITRFTKGQPAELTAPVLAEAVRLMGEWAGAMPVSGLAESYPGKQVPVQVQLSLDKVNDTLGTQFDTTMVAATLRNVEFDVEVNGTTLTITVPYWRADIHIDEDIIEEIGRLNGFDTIEPTLPKRDFVAVAPTAFDQFRSRLRHQLVHAGANEVLTYSFIHGDILKKARQSPDNSYKIINSISPDLQYYRQSITPSLLNLVNPNIRAGFADFALFEINKVHSKANGLTDENVPVEAQHAALVVASKKTSGAAYYQAKKILDYALKELGVSAGYRLLSTDTAMTGVFEPKRSADIVLDDGSVIGVIGEFRRSVQNDFKLPVFSAGFELDLEALFASGSTTSSAYTALSRFPGTERDICFQAAETVTYARVIEAVDTALGAIKLETTVTPLDFYQAEGSLTKNITIRVRLTSHKQTLTGEQVTKIVDTVARQAAASLDATII